MTTSLFIDGLTFPSAYADALILSLLSSLLWAPAVYLTALFLDRAQKLNVAEKIWMTALGVAVLPALITPALTAAGVSLRPLAPPAPPMVFVMAETAALAEEINIASSAAPFFTVVKAISLAGVLYFYGALMALFLWAAKSAAFAWTVASARRVDDAALLTNVEAWRTRMGVSVRPRLKKSARVSSVCVCGLFRPVILIPTEIDVRITADDLALMCAHEMAHIKRGDAKLFAMTAMMRVVFWFNPAIRRLAARAELSAEQSADALVVLRGANRRAYAACFVEGLKFASDKSQGRLIAVPSFTPFDRKGRRKRLDSILSDDPSATISAPKRVVLAAAGASAAMLAFGQAALAVDPGRAVRGPENGAVDKSAALYIMPVDGKISLAFGDKITGAAGEDRHRHEGVDIKARRGADVLAPAPGTVIAATDNYAGQNAWGKVIVIDHGDGLMTRYAHLDSYAIRSGDKVLTGEIIGKVGSTGVASGPHLHFETIHDGAQIDPLIALGINAVISPATVRPPEQARRTKLRHSEEELALEEELAGKKPTNSEPTGADKTGHAFDSAAGPEKFVAFEEFAQMKALETFGGFEALSAINALGPLTITASIAETSPPAASLAAPQAAHQAAPKPLSAPELMLTLDTDYLKNFVEDNALEYSMKINNGKTGIVLSAKRRLTADERAQVEKSLRQMRTQMADEVARRQRALRSSREAREKARTLQRQVVKFEHDTGNHRHPEQRELERIQRQALTEQAHALARARRDIEQSGRDNARDISTSKRDLAQVERDLAALKLPKRDLELAKSRIAKAHAAIENSAKRSKEAIARARDEIDAQQTEIKRLRAELSAEKTKDKSSR